MSWNEKQSKERVDNHDFHDFEVNIAELAKTMDFSHLGSKDVRQANAAHLYADVPNFHLQIGDAGADKAKQKKLIRAASVLRKVQTDLLKSADIIGDDELGRIQLQAVRLHSLCYKPYGDEARRARNAVVMGITLNTFIYEVFNDVFADLPRSFQSAVGISAGRSLIANLGFRGERERISLGTPANLAAKILGLGNTIIVTPEVYDLLPKALKDKFAESDTIFGAKTYKASGLRWDKEAALTKSLEVKWDASKWKKKTEEYRDVLVLDEMEVRWAEVKIDVDLLTEKNSRRTDAITIYGDLDGFTRYVQEAEADGTVKSLVRELHMIRHEFHAVLQNDYPGVTLQHQGDCVLAILHEPCGDDESDHKKRCRKALDAAIGLQSSMQNVLRKKLPNRQDLYVAIGVDVGTAIVTRLGKLGKREVVCLGPEVDVAQDLQMKSKATQIRISPAIYDTIERKAIKDEFTKDGDSYVATELTWPKIEEIEATEAAKAGSYGGITVGNRVETRTDATTQSRPWSTE
jgi:class 3 adenylate cyclase